MKIWELAKAAEKREWNGPAWNAVMSGIENALEDHEDGTEGFERYAMASLEGVLCYKNDCTKEDLEWFRSMGVRW